MRIFPAAAADAADWAAMRHALWPDQGSSGAHENEIGQLLIDPGETINLIARADDGAALGFLEAAIRRDYVNGCDTSPVGFLEGIYVDPQARGGGVARALVARAEIWMREQGCTEFASDALVDNHDSHAMHAALGFTEMERVVYFRKVLA